MSRYFLHLSYFGKPFNGWQVQKNSDETVQHYIQQALSTILRTTTEITGCGRTDAGVHAKSFYAHFDCERDNLAEEKSVLLNKLNKLAGPHIAFYDLMKVSDDASSRFDALSRSYEYHINRIKDPFQTDLAWHMSLPLNIKAMNEAAEALFDFEDFTSFSKTNTQTFTNNCKIMRAYWEEKDNKLVFYITANRFLRNMVRAVVGTLLMVGEGKINLQQFREIIESKNRSRAGKSVPAHGLYLTEVVYPEKTFKH